MSHEDLTFGAVIKIHACELFPTKRAYLGRMRGGLSDDWFNAGESERWLHTVITPYKAETHLTQSFQNVPSILTGSSRCSVGLSGGGRPP